MRPLIVPVLALWVTMTNYFGADNACDEKYTNITVEHTMCKTANENCTFLKHKGNSFEKQLLRIHNMIRNAIRGFVGKEYRLATNMELMQWDDELYEMARIHSLQCIDEPDCDLCHQNGDFPVEQNFAVKTFKKSEIKDNDLVKRFQTVIKEWAAGLQLYDPSVVNNVTTTDGLPTHWTNILRATTIFVGCASMNFYTDEPDTFKEVYICNYGPAKLTEGEEIYKTGGKPCSECKNGETCDIEFSRLCVPFHLELNTTVTLPEEFAKTSSARRSTFSRNTRRTNEEYTTYRGNAERSSYAKVSETLLTNEGNVTSIKEGESTNTGTASTEESSIKEITESLPKEHTIEVENKYLKKRRFPARILKLLTYSTKQRKKLLQKRD